MQDDLRNWLSPPDPAMNHNIACKSRLDGTAEWSLKDNTFKRWKSTKSTDTLLHVDSRETCVRFFALLLPLLMISHMARSGKSVFWFVFLSYSYPSEYLKKLMSA